MISRRTRSAHLVVAAVVGLILMAVSGPAEAYEHRTSTPSFGIQLGYGKLVRGETFHVPDYPLADGRVVAADLDLSETNTKWGPSAHFGVRFVLDRSHALGFGFDDIRYKRKTGYSADEKTKVPNWVKFTTFHVDYYLYFARRSRTSYYAAPFAGIQQRELRYRGSEVQIQEYKLLYGANIGVEYFVRRSFSIDAGARVVALRGGTGTNVVVQPALGFHVYVI